MVDHKVIEYVIQADFSGVEPVVLAFNPPVGVRDILYATDGEASLTAEGRWERMFVHRRAQQMLRLVTPMLSAVLSYLIVLFRSPRRGPKGYRASVSVGILRLSHGDGHTDSGGDVSDRHKQA